MINTGKKKYGTQLEEKVSNIQILLVSEVGKDNEKKQNSNQ